MIFITYRERATLGRVMRTGNDAVSRQKAINRRTIIAKGRVVALQANGEHSSTDVAYLLIRIHRADALATSVDPAADSKLLVRHICGNTRCVVVNHFRPGSQRENDDDKEYHRLNQGCSREHFPKRE